MVILVPDLVLKICPPSVPCLMIFHGSAEQGWRQCCWKGRQLFGLNFTSYDLIIKIDICEKVIGPLA